MKSYSDIMLELRKPFPQGTVIQSEKGRGTKTRTYIPAQVYMKRLEDTAAEQWHWAIQGNPQINLNEQVVIVIGELTIVTARRQGLGVAQLQGTQPSSIKTAIITAETEAFRDACDKFLMGWIDLAPFRDWGMSPALDFGSQKLEEIENFQEGVHSVLPIELSSPLMTGRTCIRCHTPLSPNDELILSVNQVKIAYCQKHIPKQFIKQ